jgi:hypothetical protein
MAHELLPDVQCAILGSGDAAVAATVEDDDATCERILF